MSINGLFQVEESAPESKQALEQAGGLCSVFVASCDAYSDLWKPFFTLFWKYWPGCPFPVYLGANRFRYDDHRVTTLHSAPGLPWGEQAHQQIGALNTPYVLVVLEDFFLRKPTRTDLILNLLREFISLNGEMLRLTNRPPPDEPIGSHPIIGRILPGAPYRVSTQATIWRRERLLELIGPRESIWQFEESATLRSNRFKDGFYCTWRQVLPYGYHVVQQGKWFPHEAKYFGSLGIGCDFTERPIMDRREAFRARIECAKSGVLLRLPWRHRLRLLTLAKKLRI